MQLEHWYVLMLICLKVSVLSAPAQNACEGDYIDRMACGLSVEQLLGFLQLLETFRTSSAPGSRTLAQKFSSEMEHLLCDMYTLPWAGSASQLRQQEPGWQALMFLRSAHRADRDGLYNAVCPPGMEASDEEL